MNHEPREPAAAESYSTFWEDAPRATSCQPVPGEDAYTAFVNMSEDEFPSDEWRLSSPDDSRSD